MSRYQNGAKRERDVVKFLRDHGWHAIRTPASQGVEDILAIKRDEEPLMIQVKSDRVGPYAHFGPKAREQLDLEAIRSGARAVLIWWPGDRKGMRWIDCADWPEYAGARKERHRLAV